MDNMSIEGVIQMAIAREQEAYDLYTNAKSMVTEAATVAMLEDLAQQELGHKAKLERMLKGDVDKIIARESYSKYTDLKIGDYLAPAKIEDGADFQTVLIAAMQKEKDSNQLYTELARLATGATRELFEFLAGQEMIHKNKLEALYDEVIYQEN